jgi:hypothetical protein
MTKRSLVLRGVVFAAFVFGLSPALAQAPGVPSASATYPEGPHADQQLGKRF